MLVECTGYDAVSLQPNSGAQGEYAGLLAIRAYHRSRGDDQRDICLIPESAHGTNPASAQMCGMQVVVTKCDSNGNVDVEDIRRAAEKYSDRLAAMMITYPSTHGVFEEDVVEICEIVHAARRPGVHRRRQHERPGRRRQARQVGLGRVAPQPAQDLLHPARRRRPGRRPVRGEVAPGAVPAAHARRRRRKWAWSVGGELRLGLDPADQLDVRHADGQPQACARPRRSRCSTPTTSPSAWRRTTRRSTPAATAWSRTNASSTCARSRTPPACRPKTWPSA